MVVLGSMRDTAPTEGESSTTPDCSGLGVEGDVGAVSDSSWPSETGGKVSASCVVSAVRVDVRALRLLLDDDDALEGTREEAGLTVLGAVGDFAVGDELAASNLALSALTPVDFAGVDEAGEEAEEEVEVTLGVDGGAASLDEDAIE